MTITVVITCVFFSSCYHRIYNLLYLEQFCYRIAIITVIIISIQIYSNKKTYNYNSSSSTHMNIYSRKNPCSIV